MKIAVLLASYNGEKYIKELLDSLLAQDLSELTETKSQIVSDNYDLEYSIYIHDDGSKDKTLYIINQYINEHETASISLLNGPASGSAKANFMWMLGQVEADYYMFADQDDVWTSQKTKRLYEAITRAEGKTLGEDLDKAIDKASDKAPDKVPAAAFCDMYVTDESLNAISDSFIRYIGRNPFNTAYTQIIIDNPAAGCAMMINRSLRDKALEKNVVSDIPMHDHFLLLLAAIYGHVEPVDMPLVYYRQTGNNEMGAINESFLQKVNRNVSDLVSGRMKENKTAFIAEARQLAEVMLYYEDLPADKKAVLKEFVELDSKSKAERVKFYKDNNFTRASGNAWMRLFV